MSQTNKEQTTTTKDAIQQQQVSMDDPFRSANGAKDFFKKKDRSRPFEMQDVVDVR